ncbi:hypothetical protein FB451DRAFT_1073197 [Mycena latifolia]|nr:hypothetical protein FB451DRAFT_1073197 [Mycena latifolia]
MSLCSTARRKGIFLARAFSSAGNVLHAPARAHSVSLSPEKMRALIAMYHQTETFVTRENLEQKINEAFTGKHHLLPERVSLALRDFQGLLRAREDAPTVTEWTTQQTTFSPGVGRNGEADTNLDVMWSKNNRLRDSKVIDALYGVETVGTGRALPGLETLDDNASTLEISEQEDRERYEDY